MEDLEVDSIEETKSEDGKVFTDSLKEMCLCVCKICSTKMKFNSLREHVRIQHSLRMTQYKHQYGKITYSRMTYHRCKGCGKVLRAIYATIKKHLQTVHAQSFKEYAMQYDVFKVILYSGTLLCNLILFQINQRPPFLPFNLKMTTTSFNKSS